MTVRSHCFRCLLALTLTIPAAVASAVQAPAKQPNFVVIIADDCTYRDLECFGGQARTPQLNQLCQQGLRFERCFQAAPMCSPTRHNLYTGIYPVKSGAYPNHTFVEPGIQSIGHYLKQVGYRVALSGKRHIGPATAFPFEYSGKKNNPDLDEIDQLFGQCRDTGTPFCLFACSNEPHSPWNKGDASQYPADQIQLPPYLVDTPVVRANFSRYLAEVSYFDWQVGQILDRLERHELADNTLVMVLSEQGNSFPFAKWTCYGNGLQSAMIVRWPGKVEPATKTGAMVEYVDVTPTLVEAAGGDVPPAVEGRSFLKVLRGETDQHKAHTYGVMTTRGIINGSDLYAIRTVRNDRYRLIWNLNHESTFQNACTKSDYFQSMIAASDSDPAARQWVQRYQQRPEFELYDCQQDPLELNNLAGDPTLASVQTELKAKLDQWMEQQGDQGVATEQKAILHQRRYRDLSPEAALKKYRQNRGGKSRQ